VLVKGGIKRRDSVRNGLESVQSEYVLIHDAVRPACSQKLASCIYEGVLKCDAAIPAINPVDTVKYRNEGQMTTLDRKNIFLVQTPQGFKTSEIIAAYENSKDPDPGDSSSVAQEFGMDIMIVEGERNNIKITVPRDMEYLVNIKE
jgi:2-C-methyl-D-erythritol 4-phosphate cytidylyltransferase